MGQAVKPYGTEWTEAWPGALTCGVLLWSFCLTTTVSAASEDLCDAAAGRAAAEASVPLSVLRAITRVESGRTRAKRLEPWPWTVNMEGQGKWFETKDAALAYVQDHLDRGARSFDVGCFQINYRWHGDAFRSLDDMFDPDINARYAAGFLARLHAETGDWTGAAGAYHSRTKEFAERYATRFDRIRNSLDDGPSDKPSAAQPLWAARTDPRKNTYPLLQRSAAPARFGSLVPLNHAAEPALGALLQPKGES